MLTKHAPVTLGLTASGLSFGYQDRDLFTNIDLCVKPGTSLAILGPSGMGKSTLLSILGGQLEPRTGHVELGGRRVNAEQSQQSVAWIVQSLNVLRRRTVMDNATMLGRIDGDDAETVQNRAGEALVFLGLGDMTQRRVRDLSGGEIQRTTVARAVASNRPVILADEPTNQLDSESAERVVDLLITQCASASRILVVVTHDTTVADACDQTLQLRPT